MRGFALLGVVVLGFAGAWAFPQDEAGKDQEQRLASLIKQLGDEKFTRRQAASQKLDALGEPAPGRPAESRG
jgi:hypothetical protein